jgi:hypothetical protein
VQVYLSPLASYPICPYADCLQNSPPWMHLPDEVVVHECVAGVGATTVTASADDVAGATVPGAGLWVVLATAAAVVLAGFDVGGAGFVVVAAVSGCAAVTAADPETDG